MVTTPKNRTRTGAAQQLLQIANEAASRAECWEDIHNAVYGVGGPFSQLFATPAERTAFSKTVEYDQIRKLIQSLPGRSGTSNEYNGRILVRVPKSVHAALAHEAEQEGVSLNQLIVAKLSAQLRDVAHV